MYAEYYYLANSNIADILTDLKNILTGQVTDSSLLSAACDKTQTIINTSVSQAGWTLEEDAISTSNYFVISAPITDDPNQRKYVRIRYASPYLYLELYENWSNGAGTNLAYYSNNSSYCQIVNTSYDGIIAITASPAHIGMFTYSYDPTNSLWHWGSYSGYSPTFVSEYKRMSIWDTPGSSPQVPVIWFNLGLDTGYSPKIIIPNDISYNEFTGSNAGMRLTVGISGQTPSSASSYLGGWNSGAPAIINFSTNEIAYYTAPIFTYPSYATNYVHYNTGGSITAKADIWIFPSNKGNALDRIMSGSNRYVIWIFNTSYRLLVREG